MTKIAIIGLGSQGKSWALNLKDSGYDVAIALRKNSKSSTLASKLHLNVVSYEQLSNFPTICLLIPDHLHLDALKEITPFLKEKTRIIYAHGVSYVTHKLNEMFPQFFHLLLAPKAIASELREKYLTKEMLCAVTSVENAKDEVEEQREFLNKLCLALGINKGPFERSFSEETRADLFSEQSILCSLLPYGALQSYNKLREKGISKEVAFIECWMEVKLIADAMIKFGPKEFFNLISPNALIGGEKAQKLFFDEQYKKHINTLQDDIWNGDFINEVTQTDIKALKSEVSNFWEQQELSKVYESFYEERP